MSTISLATTSMLTAGLENATPVQGEALGNGELAQGNFSLPQMAVAALTERVKAAKDAHREQNADTKTDDPGQNAELQALLALLLAQPGHEPVAQQGALPANAQLLQAMSQMQSGKPASSLLQLAGNNPQSVNVLTDADTQGNLSPKLQALMATLTAQTGNEQATPAQQSRLTQMAAQDLQAIAPQPQTTAHVSHMLQPLDRAAVRNSGVQKADHNQFIQPSLLNAAVEANPATRPAVADKAMSAQATPVVTVDTASEEWGEKLTSLLKDRIHFQIGQQQQTSTIRLDPPSLGKLEIAIQLDAGKLTVHIGANQSDVLRSLQQLSDNLRQHLTEQNFVQVHVQVSSEGQQQQQGRQQRDANQTADVMDALELENNETNNLQNESVLIKV